MTKKTALTPKLLKERTEALYPGGNRYVLGVQRLVQYYEDDAVNLTVQLLEMQGSRTPITTNMMKRVVNTLSVTYDQPPSRRLRGDGGIILPDDDPRVLAFERAVQSSGFDPHFRRIDAFRTLLGTVARRTYANDASSALSHRLFLPNCIFRAPMPGLEDDITMDDAVALKLSGDAYEMWERSEDGSWRMFITDEGGEVLREPFGEDGTSPYDVLPIQLVHDQPAEGRAFMPLNQSRIGFQENLNRVINALPEMVDLQAYAQMVMKVADTTTATAMETGPRVTNVIRTDESLEAVQRNPLIDASGNAYMRIRDQWLVAENIPIDYFNGQANQQTGAALRAQLWPLKERRDEMQPLVVLEQVHAFEIFRSVWNAHGYGDPIPEDVQLVVQVSDIPIPIDEDKLRDIGFREIAAGLSSTIMYLQRKHQISRQQAIEMYEQIKIDNAQYPPAQPMNALVDGPKEALGDGSATVSDDGFQSPPEGEDPAA